MLPKEKNTPRIRLGKPSDKQTSPLDKPTSLPHPHLEVSTVPVVPGAASTHPYFGAPAKPYVVRATCRYSIPPPTSPPHKNKNAYIPRNKKHTHPTAKAAASFAPGTPSQIQSQIPKRSKVPSLGASALASRS